MDIKNQQDILQALDTDPDFRKAMRRHLLTEDLLSLPEQFAAFILRFDALSQQVSILSQQVADFVAAQKQLNAEQHELNQKFTAFIIRQEQFNAKQEQFNGKQEQFNARQEQFNVRTEKTLNSITGRLDNGFGTNYEFKVSRNINSLAGQQLKLRRIRVLYGGTRSEENSEFQDMLERAEETGIITTEAFDDLWSVGIILSGHHRNDGAFAYAAIEASITIGDNDINRAAQRAATLATATGETTIPAVVGTRIDQQRQSLASTQNVQVIIMPEN